MNKSHKIHPTAVIAPGVTIGENVVIEPYVVINSPHVILEDRVVIKSHVYIEGYTTIGEGTVVYPSASIGTKTQDLKFRGEKTFVKIGKNCEIREFVTVNSSCQENSVVEVGDNCLIMAYCHIAHNCVIGNSVIISNNTNLAGHVEIGDHATLGGMTGIHQFVRIGKYAMVGGMSRVTHDIPPFTIGAGNPFKFGGLNSVGLKRHGFLLEVRRELSKAFKYVYRSPRRLEEALVHIENEPNLLPEVKFFLDFCRSSKRGLMCLQASEESHFDKEEEESEASLALKKS